MALLIKNVRAIDPSCDLDEVVDIVIQDGIIKEVGQNLSIEKGVTEDYSGKIALPGFFDMHVHFRDPGQEYKEDIKTGSQAAVAGGFTGVATMPNTKPTTDTAELVSYQYEKAKELGICKVYPLGAITNGLKGEHLAEMGSMYNAGALGFTDDGHGVQNGGMERTAMEYSRQFDALIISHCEDEGIVGKGVMNESPISDHLGLTGWPTLGEEIQIERDIELAKITGARLHIAHITTAKGVEMVKKAKAEGVQVSCEVCPHHLLLNEELIDSKYPVNLKMNPPLRSKEDMLKLQEYFIKGDIDCLVTDHAPHAEHEKNIHFEDAPFGIIGLETSFALIHTNFVVNGKMSYQDLVERMSIAPRRLLHTEPVQIKAGSKGDLTIIDPDKKWTFENKDIYSKSKNTPFKGYEFIGKVSDTIVDGYHSYQDFKLAK